MNETNPHLARLRNFTTQPPDTPGVEEEYSAFAFGRVGSKPQLTLRIRQVSGTTRGFVYAHLYTLDHEPSLGIILRFSQHRIVIQGRNLEEMFRYLSQFRVDLIQVTDPLHASTLADTVPVVTSVEIVAVRELVPAAG
jgi:hypothetical protein